MNWSSNDKTKKLHRNIPNKNVLTLSSALELAQMAPIIEVVPRLKELSESESLPRANLSDQGGFNNSIVHCLSPRDEHFRMDKITCLEKSICSVREYK